MKRERSTAYPVLDLATAYRVLRQDLSSLGAVELDRAEMAKRLGYQGASGGLAARKICALAQYGLLDRRAGLYGLSPLGLRLQVLDIGDTEFPSAIRTALEQPPLFKDILDRYRSAGSVPRDLAEELVDFGITQQASTHAAKVFESSALFAGVLDTDRSFRTGVARIASVPPPPVHTPQSTGFPPSDTQEWDEIPLLLPNRRQGTLKLPRPFSTTDYIALKRAFYLAYTALPEHLELQLPPKNSKSTSKSYSSDSPLRFSGRRKE